jgi:hypothetical protein
MKSALVLVALLACAAMGASAPLHAQARGSAREVRGSEPPVEKPLPVRDEAT